MSAVVEKSESAESLGGSAARTVAPEAFQHPAPELLRIWTLIGLRWTLLLMLVLGTALYLLHWEKWKIAAGVGAVALLGTALARRSAATRFEITGWQLTDSFLAVRAGGRTRSTAYIPRTRIHYAEIGAGPLERRFGLVHLLIFVAGAEAPVARLRGLKPPDAERLRRELLPELRNA